MKSKKCLKCNIFYTKDPRISRNRFLKRKFCSKACAKILRSYKISKTGCWLWQGFVNPITGYGQMEREGKSWLAHRYYYTKITGKIPKGKHLDHLCRIRYCVNPKHLEAVTQAENNQRSRIRLQERK